jgi:hypothetical protein
MATHSEGENVSDIQSLAVRAQDLGRSVDFWNTAMIWALVVAALAAIAVVATTSVALNRAKQLADVESQLADAKDRQRDIELKDRDLKIAEAGQRAEEAKDRAAQATLELAKFKTPRTLDPKQQGRISAKAKPFAGMMFDVASSNAKEPLNLVAKIEEALVFSVKHSFRSTTIRIPDLV